MKFSYQLLKKFVPKIKNADHLAGQLSLGLFEAQTVDGDRALEVEVLPNRFSDAASHWGLAREISALMGKKFNSPLIPETKAEVKKDFDVIIKTKLCHRLAARYFEELKIAPSPKWLQDVLRDCGLQPINNLVDITNYVTLETGQPLHAFDFEAIEGGILMARPAKKGEKVTSLDGKIYDLSSNDLVLADKKDALDVAGIKGGKKAEIKHNTKNILLTAGNFDGVSIYKTSRKINLTTDASARFSHGISPELVGLGIGRAAELIKELCGGRAGTMVDIYQKKPGRKLIKFHIDKFNKISGLDLKEDEALVYLRFLGFQASGEAVEVPAIRTDIERFEDLAEEILRLYGYENLPAKPPSVFLHPPVHDQQVIFKDIIKKNLVSLGLDEVYNYSLTAEEIGAFELENPVSKQFSFLRPSLLLGLAKNIDDNLRFFDSVAIFEIGKVFLGSLAKKNNIDEKLMLGVAVAGGSESFFELKGYLDELFRKIGLVSYEFIAKKQGDALMVKSDNQEIGSLFHRESGKVALAEIDLDLLLKLIEEERSYEPLPKFPSIMRDISLLVPQSVRFSDILSAIQNSAPKYVEDVDLIDFYEGSLTLRLVFLADDRTLTDDEVNREIAKISSVLVKQFDAEIR